jgi:hypothetical protein
MDPTETLNIMLDRAKVLLEMYDQEQDMPDEAHELAEAVQHLDEWLSKGGFLPSQWTPKT